MRSVEERDRWRSEFVRTDVLGPSGTDVTEVPCESSLLNANTCNPRIKLYRTECDNMALGRPRDCRMQQALDEDLRI